MDKQVGERKIPYDHTRPASEDIFVGRNDIVNQLADGLRAGRSYGLIGQPGMGKTSTLLMLQKRLLYTWTRTGTPAPIPIYFALNKRFLTNTASLFEGLLAEFLRVLTEQHGLLLSLTEREALITAARQGNLKDPLHTLSEWHYAHFSRSCRYILLLDDLHRGYGYDVLGELISVLHPLVSSEDTVVRVSLVLAGELPLEQEFRDDVSSLRALLSDIRKLTPLAFNDVEALIELAGDYGWSVEPECEKTLFTLTDGYPFKLHYYLFTALDRYGKMSNAIFQAISEDRTTQTYLDRVLKQSSPPLQESRTIEIFYSYAEQDKEWFSQLEKHFSTLRKDGSLREWHTGKIQGGESVTMRTAEHLRQADIFLPLISPDYMSSERCMREAQMALDRHTAQTATIIPIRLKPIPHPKHAIFGDLQDLPKSGEWLGMQEDANFLLAQIVEEISAIITRLRNS